MGDKCPVQHQPLPPEPAIRRADIRRMFARYLADICSVTDVIGKLRKSMIAFLGIITVV